MAVSFSWFIGQRQLDADLVRRLERARMPGGILRRDLTFGAGYAVLVVRRRHHHQHGELPPVYPPISTLRRKPAPSLAAAGCARI
eukprot:862608-Rhodomonas_salina.1